MEKGRELAIEILAKLATWNGERKQREILDLMKTGKIPDKRYENPEAKLAFYDELFVEVLVTELANYLESEGGRTYVNERLKELENLETEYVDGFNQKRKNYAIEVLEWLSEVAGQNTLSDL